MVWIRIQQHTCSRIQIKWIWILNTGINCTWLGGILKRVAIYRDSRSTFQNISFLFWSCRSGNRENYPALPGLVGPVQGNIFHIGRHCAPLPLATQAAWRVSTPVLIIFCLPLCLFFAYLSNGVQAAGGLLYFSILLPRPVNSEQCRILAQCK